MKVGDYLLNCLKEVGITEIFGVPGDYNFSLIDLLEKDQSLRFIPCRNELNAGYAADGYARMKGFGALITTFGVGELSACNAIAGAFSESVPLIHLVGAPKMMAQRLHKKMHHTLLDGNFDTFRKMVEPITAYAARVTPENAALEIPNAIQKAAETRKPVYLTIPIDVVTQEMEPRSEKMIAWQTNEHSLKEALKEIVARLHRAKSPVLISEVFVARYGLKEKVEQIAAEMNIPVVTMMMGKGSFDESLPEFKGFYCGKLGSDAVGQLVESADCVIAFGAIWDDYNTGLFTAAINPLSVINLLPDAVQIGRTVYPAIRIQDILNVFPSSEWKASDPLAAIPFPFEQENSKAPAADSELSAASYYPLFQTLIQEKDIVVAESGTFAWGMAQVRLKRNTTFIAQGGWGCIGYALPAALGACIAAPDRRVLLFTGDGSMQLNVQELSTFLENGCRPIIFVLNNQGYTIEKYLNNRSNAAYNRIPLWNYQQLPKVFNHEAFTVQVHTQDELVQAIQQAVNQQQKKLCLIEMMADPMDAPEIIHRMHQVVQEMEQDKRGILSRLGL
ncbi:MAG: thiamine pyrophosphate-binding protein [Sporolactobacillus sp.]